jgi:hypothetical protein
MDTTSTLLLSGHKCYALWQADTLLAMAAHFEWMWKKCRSQANEYLQERNIPLELEYLLQDDTSHININLDPGDDEEFDD